MINIVNEWADELCLVAPPQGPIRNLINIVPQSFPILLHFWQLLSFANNSYHFSGWVFCQLVLAHNQTSDSIQAQFPIAPKTLRSQSETVTRTSGYSLTENLYHRR